ncbi:MAG: transposase [Acidobacteriota bacterium]
MRRARITYDGAFHHVMNRGIDGKNIFKDEALKEKFIEYLVEKKEKSKIRLFAFCIMDNHFHLILENTGNRMGEFMKNLGSHYGMFFRKREKNTGYVFQGRYKSTLIQDESYLKLSLAYTLRNPVKSNLIEVYDKYKWSSGNLYFAENSGEIVDTNFVDDLFESKAYLTQLVRSVEYDELSVLNTKYGDILGGEEFLKTALNKYNRRDGKSSTDRQRVCDKYFEPIEKIYNEFERKYKLSIDKIDTGTFEGKRLRGELLVLLKDLGGMKYMEIIKHDLFSDLQLSSLGSIYKNSRKKKK